MTIDKKLNGSKLTIAVGGRLDTTTSPELEAQLDLNGITDLTFDMKELDYVSSAGLRLLLKAQKQMNTQGDMRLVNVNDIVMEVFEVTGFSSILKVE
ncbi:MAG TPA: anti-sigma factor antagonist [Sphaerochaeta sp.]|nr:anti-sigma factor antagonist [Sphaerochaeta sp.]